MARLLPLWQHGQEEARVEALGAADRRDPVADVEQAVDLHAQAVFAAQVGQSLGSLTHWVFAAITSFAFPPIIGAFGAGVAFSIFFVAMIGQLLWVLKVMPETKGVPLEEMEEKLGLTHDTGPVDPLAAGGH